MFLFVDQGTPTASNPLELQWVSGKREAMAGVPRPRTLRSTMGITGRSIGAPSL
jgi:hypothetical protein